jgi:hypothetical protein
MRSPGASPYSHKGASRFPYNLLILLTSYPTPAVVEEVLTGGAFCAIHPKMVLTASSSPALAIDGCRHRTDAPGN